MKPKTNLHKLKKLLKAPSFTSKEAAELGVSATSLSHYIKTGDIIRLGHGIYRGANTTVTDDFRWEDLIDAMARVKQGVICLTSALALYELTDEIPRQHWIAIPQNTCHRSKGNIKIIRLRNSELGKTTIKIGKIKLPIYDRERTIVDAFRFLSKETAIKALRNSIEGSSPVKLNTKKLIQYAKILHVDIQPYLLGIMTK